MWGYIYTKNKILEYMYMTLVPVLNVYKNFWSFGFPPLFSFISKFITMVILSMHFISLHFKIIVAFSALPKVFENYVFENYWLVFESV